MDVKLFQLAVVIAWSVACVFLAPAAWRSLRGRADSRDDKRAALFFAGLLFIGFAGRWLVVPGQVQLWKLMYAASVLLAVYVCLLLWNGRKRS